MEAFRHIFDEIVSLVPYPDFSPKGPYGVIALDGVERFSVFTRRERDASHPTYGQAQRLVRVLEPFIEKYGCSIGVETAKIISPENPRIGMLAWELIVSPSEGQSISTFASSLQAIATALENSTGFSIASEDTDLQAFIPRFSQAIRGAVVTHKHGKYPF